MSAEDRWQRVRSLFTQSLDQTDLARERWLREQCGADTDLLDELHRLLGQRSQPAKIFRDGAQGLLSAWLPEESEIDPLLGSNVGNYRLERLLGVGGMGRVYLAARIDDQFAHRVALKLIRTEFASSELRQRFQRERNTLARLAHPNIAALYDGGVTTQGTPYFTLEYVEGEPITRWCDTRNAGLATRIGLVLGVCDAVMHAHRSLIVHRDLKPSNVLVNAEGEAKLLDFGIAKPLTDDAAGSALTNAESRPMTREYAAPEQLLGDPVTTATDIYALGILLYLLACGHMPYARAERGEITWTKAILEDAPEPMEQAIAREDAASVAAKRATTPAALARSLRGDLESIVQRALAKSPDARYATVEAFASDLRAHLDGRAISGGTRTYRMRKFVRRHWLPLAAGALLFLVTLASAIGLGWQARRIAAEAQSTAAVKDFLLGLFRDADPLQQKGHEVTARALIDRGADRVATGMQNQVLLRGELEAVLGEIYVDLTSFEKADKVQERAVADLIQGEAPAALIARTETQRAYSLINGNNEDLANTVVLDALARLRTLSPPPPEDLARTLGQLSYVMISRHKFADALASANEAAVVARKDGVSNDTLAYVLHIAAQAARGTHDLDKSEQLQREVIALHRSQRGDNDPTVAVDYNELSEIVDASGRLADARDLRRQAVEIVQVQLGDEDWRLNEIRLAYADILMIFGRFQEAHAMIERTRTFYERAEDPVLMQWTAAHLAESEGDYATLEEVSRLIIDKVRAKEGPNTRYERSLGFELAEIHAREGKVTQAVDELAALGTQPMDNYLVGRVKIATARGEVARLHGDYAQSEQILREVLSGPHSGHGNVRFEFAVLTDSLALTLALAGKNDEAEKLLQQAIAAFDDMSRGETIPASARAMYELARLRAARNDQSADTVMLAQRAETALTTFYGKDSNYARDAQSLAAKLSAASVAGSEANKASATK